MDERLNFKLNHAICIVMINIWCHQILRSCLTRPYSYSSLITTSNNKGNSIFWGFGTCITCLAGEKKLLFYRWYENDDMGFSVCWFNQSLYSTVAFNHIDTKLFNISIKHLYGTFRITQFSDYSSIELFR